MFDNIKLKICPPPKKISLSRRIENIRHTDENSYRGYIKNMQVYKNINCVTIYGSLPKYLQGENITPLDREKIKLAIKKLEGDIGFSFKNAFVCSVEFGISVKTQEKPFEYLSLFGYPKRLTRVVFSKWNETETVTYTSGKGSFAFTAYDKRKEMLAKKNDEPPFFANSNVLRLEHKILGRKGIKAKFGRDLSAYDLFNEDVYKAFQELFLKAYEDIDKMGRLVYSDKLEKLTPSRIRKLQAEQYRQKYPNEYQYFIQGAKEAGKLSPRNLEEIRRADRKFNRDVSISDRNILIKELDAYILDVMAT